MADNTDQKVLDNFIKASANLNRWNKALKEAQKEGNKTAAEMRNIAKELAKANNEYNEAKATIENAVKPKDLLKEYADQQKALLSMIGEDRDIRIKEVEEKYKKAAEDFAKLQLPVITDEGGDDSSANYQEAMLEQAAYESELEKQKQEDIKAIRDEYLKSQMADIDEFIAINNEVELAKYIDNQREKGRIAVEMAVQSQAEKEALLGQLLEEEKITQEEHDREVYKSNAELRTQQLQQVQTELAADLAASSGNAKAKYELKKAALEKELELVKGNSDRENEINQKMRENKQEYFKSCVEEAEKYSKKLQEGLTAGNELSKQIAQSQTEEAVKETEEKKKQLKELLNDNTITQKQYNEGVEKADKELAEKKAEIARKQAIREKAMAVFQIGVNTAMAIMKIWAEVPKLDFGISTIALTAVAATVGAIQMAAAIAKPLPKAARGMLLKGKSHALGGIPLEAEGGEAIINKRSTSMFAPLLSAINEAGGGIPFARPMSDGGFATRAMESSRLTGRDIETAMENAISKQRVYITVEDYRRADEKYTVVEDVARF